MKNVLSTLALLAIIAAIGIGWFYYTSIAGGKKTAAPLNAKKSIAGMLAPATQLRIWDHENWAFKIRKHIGEKVAAGWANREDQAILQFLDGEFTSDIPTDSKWVAKSQGDLEQKIRITGEEEILSGEAAEFLEYLYEPIFGFKIDRYDFQILEIDKTETRIQCKVLLEGSGSDENGNQKSYRNTADVFFRPSRSPEEEKIAPAVMLSWNTRKEVLSSVPSTLLREVTNDLGIHRVDLPDNWELKVGTPAVQSFQMAVEDFDLDGDYDISIMTSGGHRRILQYGDGKFRDATKKLGIPASDMDPFASSVFPTAWIDLDNDGYPDLLSGIRVFKNEGGEKFTVMKKTGLFIETEITGFSLADFNCDGLVDVYTYYTRPYGLAEKQASEDQPKGSANWIDDNGTGKQNRLYQNNGDFTFTHVTELTDSSGDFHQTTSTAWMFHNDDHFPDLYLVNDLGPDRLLINSDNGDFFSNVGDSLECCKVRKNVGITTGDFDNDGNCDIFCTGLFSSAGNRMLTTLKEEAYADSVFEKLKSVGAGNTLHLHKGENYSDISASFNAEQTGWAWGASSLDLDSDGWLDLYVTSGFISFDREKEDGLPSFWKAVATLLKTVF